ncbi:hypothetical protein [Legionella longbeachae]|uniref:Secreted protein n=1 Tax=Legionella longbeachae serogroup 1 (strain NSW150) TaxID=661367 RepID=D3HJJ3_LEGLN|nr:hypothetical protein [Legionella longbeachae]VEE03120.1 secreted protein [Legionella oakridgensis]HBD7399240.1 hypothetical protein [Legionella pneumophila]ARB93979.1 hypothetical protein A6J40_18110 [Legionella longbeachae]ARM32883.1 hypothetical protein B0B39_04840 [Legionella longbeachae]EEZ94305.1 conserved hypothetical protein [Legionella longbeachae D-4968]
MRYLYFLFNLGLIFVATLSYAQGQHVHSHQYPVKNEASNANIKIFIQQAPKILLANKPATIRFQLLKDNKALTFDELKEVHTKKIHVLIIDPSLSDYHHVHPVIDSKKQDFVFNFTPKNTGPYQMWVDITPLQTDAQEFLVTDLGSPPLNPLIKEKVVLNTTMNPYEFTLKLDGEPKAGQEVMATITVTKNGKPFTKLEPVMGAFAHVVGFSGDHSSILHIHPMGKEPTSESDRGGAELMFHIGLKKTGFVKLFAQFRINEQDVYVPFAIRVS